MGASRLSSIDFEGKDLQLWTYDQLDALGRPQLKQRALNLRDTIGSDRLPPMPPGGSQMIEWVIKVQVAIASSSGLEVSPADFGFKSDSNDEAYFGGGGGSRAPRVEAPQQVQSEPNPELSSAYADAQRVAEAAKIRNRGQGLW